MIEKKGSPQPIGPDVDTVENHAKLSGVEAWEFAAAKALKGWAEGQEISAGDFRKAIKEARGERVG